MDKILTVEIIEFKRPNSDKVEKGINVSDDTGRAVIIDSDLNPIVHASYEGYCGYSVNVVLCS